MLKTLAVGVALWLGATPHVVDGDTVKLLGVRIRLVDYDAPELFHPRCERERSLAIAAKRALEAATLRLTLVACATANYGRLCARDPSIAGAMIAAGLGAPYIAQGTWLPAKRDWCR